MPTSPPHRGRVRSPTASPRTSPRNSPKRRPLHERSDSEANEQKLPDYFDLKQLSHHAAADGDTEHVYLKDPFPTLPSQVLTPSGGFPIFEDSTATTQRENAVVTRTASPRHVRTKSEKGKAKRRPSPERASQASMQSFDLMPSARASPQSASLVSLRKHQLEALDAAVKRAEQIRAEQLASRASMRPLPSSNSAADEARDRAFLAKYQSLVLDRFAPGERASVQLPDSESYFERPRSRASSYTISRPASRHSRPTSQHSNRKSEDRPRSASQPLPGLTEADLSTLLREGIQVQYARIKQPSMASLRSESSSIRGAYPAPLRLKRKRAEDLLVSTPSGPQLAPTTTSPDTSPNMRSRPSFASSKSKKSESRKSGRQQANASPGQHFVVEFPDSPDMDLSLTLPEQTHHQSTYTDELGDTLGELYAPALRPQRSGYFSDRGTASRPGSTRSLASQSSTNSLATHQQFLTFFLNDSHTTWAQSYYGGKGRLYLEAPSVINLNPLPVQRPTTPLTGVPPSTSNWSSISGMSESSYSSSDIPSQIYVPRIRAFRGAHTSHSIANEESRHTSQSFSYTTGDDASMRNASIREAQQGTRQQPVEYYRPHDITDTFVEPHRPHDPINELPDFLHLPETPRLRPDKNLGFSMYSLRAPSLDHYEAPWGQVNRQYWMLLLGFMFPLSWMVAAWLPIPSRPNWRRNSADSPNLEEGEITDLWNSQEVRRYQKARRWRVFNRFMSFFGLCVVGVVIAFAIIGVRS